MQLFDNMDTYKNLLLASITLGGGDSPLLVVVVVVGPEL